MYNQVNIREAIPLSPDLRQEETMNDVIYNPIIPNDPDDPNDLAEAVERTRNRKSQILEPDFIRNRASIILVTTLSYQ